jgi:tetratricopeptide (TPR) repeat protein
VRVVRAGSADVDVQVESLFDSGRYSEAAALYDAIEDRGSRSIGASLLRARIFLRTDPAQAFTLLNSIRPIKSSPEYVWREALLGAAYTSHGDFRAADTHFAAAMRTARARGDRDLISAVGFRMGRRCIVANDAAGARVALEICRQGVSPAAKIEALSLESFVHSRELRFAEEARVLVEVLRLIDPNDTAHMDARAWSTHTLAALGRELPIPDAAPEVERQLGGTPWPDDFRMNRFQTTRALGWTKALQGDYFNGFRHLKQAGQVAPSDAWKTVVACDRAYLARSIGEPRWSRQEIDDAEACAHGVQWELCNFDEPLALLLLAELFAPIDAAKASAYVARFRALGEPRICGRRRRRGAWRPQASTVAAARRFESLLGYRIRLARRSLRAAPPSDHASGEVPEPRGGKTAKLFVELASR